MSSSSPSFTNILFQNVVSNLFGTIGNQSMGLATGLDFIPANNKGDIITLKGDIGAAWLGLQNPLMQKFAYEFCYPVSSIADRLAEMYITGELEINRSGGKGAEEPATSPYAKDMNRLFEQPNPFQALSEFMAQQFLYKKVFGYCPVLVVLPSGFDGLPWKATAMINLPPWLFGVVRNPEANLFAPEINRVQYYYCSIYGKQIKIDPKYIILLSDSPWMDERSDFLLPKSKLVGLDMAVSNICAAMEADNVLLKKKGPLGFIGRDPGDKDSVAGNLPMSIKQKKLLQRDLTRYGLSLNQMQYVITRGMAKWNPMSFDVKQLDTAGTILKNEKAICHRYGFPYVLYEASESTYANQFQAARDVYQNIIIPESDKDMEKYEKFFLAEENNCDIDLCYDHLPVMAEDKKEKATARNTMTSALSTEYKSGIITKNQWRVELGIPTTPDGDVYYQEPQQLPQ